MTRTTGRAQQLPSPDDIVRSFDGWDLDAQARRYLHYHRHRYAVLVRLIDELLCDLAASRPNGVRLLDVGPSFEIELLRRLYPNVTVDSLGFDDPGFAPRRGERHIELDLDAVVRSGMSVVSDSLPYHLVVFSEVLEHLCSPPVAVLRSLAPILQDRGYLLLQTPNVVALHRRVRLLVGRSPYEEPESGPEVGHVREYSLHELTTAAGRAGFRVARRTTANYFDKGTRTARLYRALGPLLPPGLRHGITLVLARQ